MRQGIVTGIRVDESGPAGAEAVAAVHTIFLLETRPSLTSGIVRPNL